MAVHSPAQACIQICIEGAAEKLPEAISFLMGKCGSLREAFPCMPLLLPPLGAQEQAPATAGGSTIRWHVHHLFSSWLRDSASCLLIVAFAATLSVVSLT